MKITNLIALSVFVLGFGVAKAQQNLKVKVFDEQNIPVSQAIALLSNNSSKISNKDGELTFETLPKGRYTLKIQMTGFKTTTITVSIADQEIYLPVFLKLEGNVLDELEVFGQRNKKPNKLELLTRLPLKPSDNIQTVSVISSKVIEAQGALTITDAVRNVPGVIQFASYGGVSESMSTRGYRGVPVLKNGVRIDSDFRTAGGLTDMQGIESIQMIKGAASITQGASQDLGAAGGVINLVTKTPQFVHAASVGLRLGSWGQFRPTFDYQTVLNDQSTIAFRMNGAYERADSYRAHLHSNRVYFNPSISWKPTENTTVTLEADYLNDERKPHVSAVNLADQDENKIYLLPYNKYLGFSAEKNYTQIKNFMAQVHHKLNEKFSVRVSYASGSNNISEIASRTKPLYKNKDYHIRTRTLSKSLTDDNNSTFQLDLVGEKLQTGGIKHTVQVGADFRSVNAIYTGFNTIYANNAKIADTINVLQSVPNDLAAIKVGQKSLFVGFEDDKNPRVTAMTNFGLMAQDFIEFTPWLKTILGIKYSEVYAQDAKGVQSANYSAWNPLLGIMVSPISEMNLFVSYTNTTDFRSAAGLLKSGELVGPSPTQQFEFGIKSGWLEDRLRFSATYFNIYTNNLANTEYIPGTNQRTGYVFQAGDLKRQGLEIELNGRILKNLTAMIGYAYLDAKYKNSPSYVENSAPMNAPKNTFNAWLQYNISGGFFQGLSLSSGIYYVGKRPVNEYSLTPDGHGNLGGVKPFDMPSYYTLNAQVAYSIQRWQARFFLNNITNQMGINSYFRGGYLNQIDPINMALALEYKF